MIKATKKLVTENLYLLLGIIIGLYISSFISTSLEISCDSSSVSRNGLLVDDQLAQEIINNSINRLSPRILPERRPKKKKSKVIRSRHYSTELGIREKLFIGVFTSEEHVNTYATRLNRTIGPVIKPIRFFMSAQYKIQTKFNLSGLVGFTDTRAKFRPFQIIKYVGDTYSNDYDYYFFINDYAYINIHRLKNIVNNISISMNVYLGTKIPDSNYCDLDAGILISNSVLKAMRKELEWCIMHSVNDNYSVNFGRCVHHSIGLSCQETVQYQSLNSFKVTYPQIGQYLQQMSKDKKFNAAVILYPVLEDLDFYTLNAYFLKQRLITYHNAIDELSKTLKEWPPGQKKSAKPATRFDLPRQYYFNLTHVFFPDDFTMIRLHTESELIDIKNVLKQVISKVVTEYSKQLTYKRLINGYKSFDFSRGMEYILDLGFRDMDTGKEVMKRFEVVKPLGSVEFIPAAYVTENTRVIIVLPVEEHEADIAMHFLTSYNSSIMAKKEKTYLLVVFMYQYKTNSQGPNDTFGKLKTFINEVNNKYKSEDVKMGWLSIRLPESSTTITFQNTKALKFSVIDLALKKVGVESLVLVLDIYCNITVDFLNRVRMNTILNYQIFSPIPFRQYNPVISKYVRLEVNKFSGHFDREEYGYLAFYGNDYIKARKKYQGIVPLIRIDNDISKLLQDDIRDNGNIFEMFVKFGGDLHCMRSTDMNLKILYHNETDENKNCKFYGNEAQLANLLLTKKDEIPELA